MQNNPPCSHNCDHEHDRRFHQFGPPRAETWDDPQRADSPRYEARSDTSAKYSTRPLSICMTSLPRSALGSFSMHLRLARGVPVSLTTIRPEGPGRGPCERVAEGYL